MGFLLLMLSILTIIDYVHSDWAYLNKIAIPIASSSMRNINTNYNYFSINVQNSVGYGLWNFIPIPNAPYYSNISYFQVNQTYFSFSIKSEDSQRFLYISNSCYQYKNLSTSLIYAPGGGQSIQSCQYVGNFDIIFVIANSSKFTLNYMKDYNVISTKALSAVKLLSCGPLFDLIFLQNNSGINLYSADSNFTFVKFLPYTSSQKTFYCDNQQDYFLYCMDGKNYYLVNKTANFSIVYQGYVSSIRRLVLSYPYYILVNDNNLVISQIDVEVKETIYQTTKILLSDLIYSISIQNKTYFLLGNFSSFYLQLIVATNQYLCTRNCSSCFETYTLDLSTNMCVKNGKQAAPIQLGIQQAIQSTTPYDQALNFLSINLGFILQMTSNKPLTKGSIYFIIFIDDLELYQYHQVNYSQIVQFVIQNANEINSIRLVPQFLTGFIDSNIQQFASQDLIYKNYLTLTSKSPSSYYFLSSTQSIYIGNFVLNALQFVGTKLIYYLFYFIHKKCGYFEKVSCWLGNNTRWWVFCLMFFESNMMYLSFNFFLQLVQPLTASFTFQNKLNLIAAILSFQAFLVYCLCFYLMLRYFFKKQAKIVLNNRARSTSKGYFCESFCRIVRNLSRGFLHAFFLDSYKVQIIGLASVGFFTTAFLLIFRKSYKSPIDYWLYFAYHFCFFLFDVTLAIHYLCPQLFQNLDYNLLNKINIYGLCLLISCLMLVNILRLFALLITKIKKIILQKKTIQKICQKRQNLQFFNKKHTQVDKNLAKKLKEKTKLKCKVQQYGFKDSKINSHSQDSRPTFIIVASNKKLPISPKTDVKKYSKVGNHTRKLNSNTVSPLMSLRKNKTIQE